MGILDKFNPKNIIMDSLIPMFEERLNNGDVADFLENLKCDFFEKCDDDETVEFLISTETIKKVDVIMINVVSLDKNLQIRVLKQYSVNELLKLIKTKANE